MRTSPKTERITVISGTFHLGMGETFDPSKSNVMPAGTFGYWGEGMRHYAWARGETVLQLHASDRGRSRTLTLLTIPASRRSPPLSLRSRRERLNAARRTAMKSRGSNETLPVPTILLAFGDFTWTATTLERPVIARILAHLGLDPRPSPRAPTPSRWSIKPAEPHCGTEGRVELPAESAGRCQHQSQPPE